MGVLEFVELHRNWVLMIMAVLLVNSIVCGCLCTYLSLYKGRKLYFWVGFFCGVIGLIYVAGLPMDLKMRDRDNLVRALYTQRVKGMSEEEVTHTLAKLNANTEVLSKPEE